MTLVSFETHLGDAYAHVGGGQLPLIHFKASEEKIGRCRIYCPHVQGGEPHSEPKLTFNIAHHPVFQNIRNILQVVHLLLAPDKKQKKVLPNVPVVRIRNGKSLKDYLVRAVLPKTNKSGRYEPCGNQTYSVCNTIRTNTTFTTAEACRETFKIQGDPLKL